MKTHVEYDDFGEYLETDDLELTDWFGESADRGIPWWNNRERRDKIQAGLSME